MTAVAITDANVQKISADEGTNIQFGETITPGKIAYLHTDNKYYIASNDDSAKQNASVFVTQGGETDSYGVGIGTKGAEVDVGGTLVPGDPYMLGASGAIIPVADLGTGDYATLVGIAKTTTNMLINFHATGAQAP